MSFKQKGRKETLLGFAVLAFLAWTNQPLQLAESKTEGPAEKSETKSCCAGKNSESTGFQPASVYGGKTGVLANSQIKAGTRIADSKDSKSDSESKDKSDKPADSKAADRKPVLEPANIAGFASFGYASAKACPEVMEKLFCYCGCDMTDSHNSLLDCFTSLHGIDCHICQEEALLANKLNKEGMSIKDIQKTVDEKYSSQYPFESDTATYKKYKATRLYGGGAESGATDASKSAVKFGEQAAGPDAPEEATKGKKPKLKPGKKMSKCCAGDHGKNDDSKDKKDKGKEQEKEKSTD